MVYPPRKTRIASLHGVEYANFVQRIIEHRTEAGLRQRDVAEALGWNQSIVAKIETAQRRLDVIEYVRLANVIGFDPTRLVGEFHRELKHKQSTEV